jgi:hypothetical protein
MVTVDIERVEGVRCERVRGSQLTVITIEFWIPVRERTNQWNRDKIEGRQEKRRQGRGGEGQRNKQGIKSTRNRCRPRNGRVYARGELGRRKGRIKG